jgi:hypothetical protein
MMAAAGFPTRLSVPGRPSLLEGSYLFIILLALLSYGAVYSIPLAICTVSAAALTMVALALKGVPVRTAVPLWAGVFVFAGLSLWILLQAVPLPGGLLAAPIWQDLSRLGLEGRPTISVAPAEALSGWLRLALPFFVFLVALILLDSDERALLVFNIAAIGGGLLAVAGLLQYLLFPGYLLFSEKFAYFDSLTFVFVNRNTAATCLGLIGLMVFTRAWQEWTQLDHARIVAWAMNGVPLGKLAHFAPFLIQAGLLLATLLALSLTRSRAGVGSTAVAAIVTLALLSWFGGGQSSRPGFSRRRRSVLSKVVRFAVSAAIVLAIVALLAPQAILRGEVQGVEDARFCIMDSLLATAKSNLFSGGGFGAFSFNFDPFRDPACGISGFWDKAHNIYLDGIIGLGLMFVPAVLLGVWVLVRAYGAGLRERRSLRIYPIVGLAGLVLVLVHGLVDFSLQIPGMATVYAFFAAATLTISLGRGRPTIRMGSEENSPSARRRLGHRVGVLVLCILSAAAVLASLSDAHTTVSNRPVQQFARALDAGSPVDGRSLSALVADLPASSSYLQCRADVVRQTLTVLLADLDRIDRGADYARWAQRVEATEAYVRHALSCMPADGNLWLRLAMLRQAGGEVPAEQAELMAMSQLLIPAERNLLVGRLAHWNRLSAATVILAGDVVETDVRNALVYLPASILKPVIGAPSDQMLRVIMQTVPLLSENHLKWLQQGGLVWAKKPQGT